MWYMRGSISMNDARGHTFEDKKQIQEFLKENQERFKGAMSPIVKFVLEDTNFIVS